MTIPAEQHVIGTIKGRTRAEPIVIDVAPGGTVTVEVANTHGVSLVAYAIKMSRNTCPTLRRV